MTEPKPLRIAKTVGNALDFAHRKVVVHRDINPANILLQDGQPLRARTCIRSRAWCTSCSPGSPRYQGGNAQAVLARILTEEARTL